MNEEAIARIRRLRRLEPLSRGKELQEISAWGFYCSRCGHRWTPPVKRCTKISRKVVSASIYESPPRDVKTPEACPCCASPCWWHRRFDQRFDKLQTRRGRGFNSFMLERLEPLEPLSRGQKLQRIRAWGFYCSWCGHRWTLPTKFREHKEGVRVFAATAIESWLPENVETPEACPRCTSDHWWHRRFSRYFDVDAPAFERREAKKLERAIQRNVARWTTTLERISDADLNKPIETNNNISLDDRTTISFSYRIGEALLSHNIKTLGHLIVLSSEDLCSLEGISDKAIDDIEEELARFKFILRPDGADIPDKLKPYLDRPPPRLVVLQQRYLLFGARLTVAEIAWIANVSKPRLANLLWQRIPPERAISEEFFPHVKKGSLREPRKKKNHS